MPCANEGNYMPWTCLLNDGHDTKRTYYSQHDGAYIYSRIMKWRALPKWHPPRDQGQSTGPFYVKIKIPQIASRYSLGFFKVFTRDFLLNSGPLVDACKQ